MERRLILMPDGNKTENGSIYPATVVKIVDKYTIAINAGKNHDIREGQNFLIYSLSEEEIIDPISHESLGKLEIVKGKGVVINVQEKMSSIESDEEEDAERTIYRDYLSFGRETVKVKTEKLPFRKVQIGDLAKPI